MKFYKSALPPEGTIVAVRVDEITEYGVLVTLLEYDVSGLIVAGEVSRKRIRSIKEVVRVGQETAATVTKIDNTSGTVDLSIKVCSPDEITEKLIEYGKHRTIYGLFKNLSEITGVPIETHLEQFVWPVLERGEDVYERFVSLNTPSRDVAGVLGETSYTDQILQLVAKKLPTPSFTATKIEKLQCFNGLQAPELLTKALNAAAGAAEGDVSIWIVSPPEYKFVAVAPTQAEADEKVARAVAVARAELTGAA